MTSTPVTGLTDVQQAAPRSEDESVEDDPTTFINGPLVMEHFNNWHPNTEDSDVRSGQTFLML